MLHKKTDSSALLLEMTMDKNKPIALRLILLLALSITFNVSAQDISKETAPVLQLEESTFDFGDLKQGDKVSHEFILKNDGKSPLVISNVITTCGCTAPEWPKTPIAPKQSATIKIAFDSRGRAGVQNKVITIISNAKTPQGRIRIKANVLPKD